MLETDAFGLDTPVLRLSSAQFMGSCKAQRSYGFWCGDGSVGGSVVSESALRSAGTLLSRVRVRHRRPGLAEGLKA
ncbi:hypothetical protein PoB_006996000 [Plakobranchus ocellatus]|uniref:Uncharacterized protein n=1 Tax=Plakobranchus ocellatus TaxID=259542 RepID=A0AAV4DHE4_9GAST|nr:hypothetical protein PoB_006996000 [Plakobranchus ocellatus]